MNAPAIPGEYAAAAPAGVAGAAVASMRYQSIVTATVRLKES
jgi:hypothetical protein